MPRSIKRRLERIEGQAGRKPAPVREVLDMLEEQVASGHPYTRGEAFRAAHSLKGASRAVDLGRTCRREALALLEAHRR